MIGFGRKEELISDFFFGRARTQPFQPVPLAYYWHRVGDPLERCAAPRASAGVACGRRETAAKIGHTILRLGEVFEKFQVGQSSLILEPILGRSLHFFAQ
jgi:hypothetical protein